MKSETRSQNEDVEIQRRDRNTEPPKMKVVGSRVLWDGHIYRMGQDGLTKRTWKTGQCGRRRRGKPTLTSHVKIVFREISKKAG